MRRMADSVDVANLPDGFDLYGAYDDGNYNNVNAVKARFPNKPVLAITVFAEDDFGDVLDVETGDATPAQAPGWVQARRAKGHGGPIVYCSENIWANVKQTFANAGIAQPGYWIAGYPGSVGEALYPGSVGHQWIDRGPYDESVVADYLPGIDPPPAPPQHLIEGETMTSLVQGGQLHVWGVVNNVAYHWWQEIGPPASAWHVEPMPV